MPTKSITLFASMVAVLAALTTVAPASAAGRGVAASPDGSYQVAQRVWWEPRRPPAACACVRG
jgi:hypothetical protein